jgi:hypothetical protein
MKISAGLQDSGTTDESTTENVEADRNLVELIELHKNTDWREVLGFNTAETSTWRTHLIEGRKTVQQSVMEGRTLLGTVIALSEMSVSASNVAAAGGSDDTNEDDGNSELNDGRNTVMNTFAGWWSGRTATTIAQNHD